MSRPRTKPKVEIIHVLKDGTVLKDITGHVVRYEDCPEVYRILAEITIQQRAAAQRAAALSEDSKSADGAS